VALAQGRVFFGVRKNLATAYRVLRVTFPYLFGYRSEYRENTEQYPDRVSARMPEDLPAKVRGILKNDIEKCSGCRYCADVCPVNCIEIETEVGPDRSLSWVSVFDIDHSKCIFCGMCVESCPTGSLIHTKEYEASTEKLDSLVMGFGRGWVTQNMKDAWNREQQAKEAKAEEAAVNELSPISAEIKRRLEGS